VEPPSRASPRRRVLTRQAPDPGSGIGRINRHARFPPAQPSGRLATGNPLGYPGIPGCHAGRRVPSSMAGARLAASARAASARNPWLA
jgi:hypothetical protein